MRKYAQHPKNQAFSPQKSFRFEKSRLAAGAAAKANDLGGVVVADAYAGLKALLIKKLGKSGAIQGLEEAPDSESAQTAVAETIAKTGLHEDEALKAQAAALMAAVESAPKSSDGDINVSDIVAKADIIVRNLFAARRIDVTSITSDQSVLIENLSAGAEPAKKV